MRRLIPLVTVRFIKSLLPAKKWHITPVKTQLDMFILQFFFPNQFYKIHCVSLSYFEGLVGGFFLSLNRARLAVSSLYAKLKLIL